MRKAIVLDGINPVNVIVLPDGADGDALLSASCVEITDLDPKPGLGTGWTFVDGAFVPPPVLPLTYAQVEAQRHAAYVTDADPVFFRWQRGQATEQDWLDAVAAVDAAHPYPAPL